MLTTGVEEIELLRAEGEREPRTDGVWYRAGRNERAVLVLHLEPANGILEQERQPPVAAKAGSASVSVNGKENCSLGVRSRSASSSFEFALLNRRVV